MEMHITAVSISPQLEPVIGKNKPGAGDVTAVFVSVWGMAAWKEIGAEFVGKAINPGWVSG